MIDKIYRTFISVPVSKEIMSKKIDKFEPIINRIDSESIESMRAESGGKK